MSKLSRNRKEPKMNIAELHDLLLDYPDACRLTGISLRRNASANERLPFYTIRSQRMTVTNDERLIDIFTDVDVFCDWLLGRLRRWGYGQGIEVGENLSNGVPSYVIVDEDGEYATDLEAHLAAVRSWTARNARTWTREVPADGDETWVSLFVKPHHRYRTLRLVTCRRGAFGFRSPNPKWMDALYAPWHRTDPLTPVLLLDRIPLPPGTTIKKSDDELKRVALPESAATRSHGDQEAGRPRDGSALRLAELEEKVGSLTAENERLRTTDLIGLEAMRNELLSLRVRLGGTTHDLVVIGGRLRSLQDRHERLCTAARTLLGKLDAVYNDPRYKAVWTCALVHGDIYKDGPNWSDEVDALRRAVREVSL